MQHLKRTWLLNVLCVISIVYALIFHVKVHIDSAKDIKSPNTFNWTQPNSLNGLYSGPISNRKTQFNYAGIEKIAWQFSSTGAGQLLINKGSADQLELACSYIDEQAPQSDQARLAFLIQKSVPNQAGVQLSELLTSYCQYLPLERTRAASISTTSGATQLVLLKGYPDQLEALQKELFGNKIAKELFATKNATMRYFNQRRIINLRTDLAPAEKTEFLSQLQDDYKRSLAGH